MPLEGFTLLFRTYTIQKLYSPGRVKLLPENNRRLRYLSKEECKAPINACSPHLRPVVITALKQACGKRRHFPLNGKSILI